MEQKILNYYKEHEAEIFEDLKNFTLVEASTSDLDALLEVRKHLEKLIVDRTGIEPFVYETAGRHDVVKFSYGEGEEKVVVVGHYDTVHPIGALPYVIDGNKLKGPGVRYEEWSGFRDLGDQSIPGSGYRSG